MKSDAVVSCLRAFVRGDREHAISVMQQIAADEARNGRNRVADTMKRLVRSANGNGKLIPLPQKQPNCLTVSHSDREMKSLILSESVQTQVESLFTEWRNKDVLQEHGVPLRQVVLLCGPSGNGKTALAEAVANELRLPIAIANYSEMISSYLGSTGKQLASAFEFAKQSPCVLFFDEADSLCMSRSSGDGGSEREQNRIVNQLLISLDQISQQAIVFLATNFEAQFDAAMRRRVKLEMNLEGPTETQKLALIDLKRQVWPFLEVGPTYQLIDKCKSFAECEDVIVGIAREHVLATVV